MKRIIFWSFISLIVIPLTLYQSPQIKFKLLEIFADRVKLSQDFMSNDSLNLVYVVQDHLWQHQEEQRHVLL